jgi:hypothetical protein
MNPISLNIIFADGTEKEVTAVAADLVAFEERFDMSIAQLEKNVRMTHLFFLGWNAMRRTKQTEAEFEAWIETVSMVALGQVKKSKA